MGSLFARRAAPGPLSGNTDLYDYFETAAFFENRPEQAAELGEQLFAVWQADMELMNGGIAQLLLNGSGDLAEEAVTGFKTFGLPEIGALLAEAFEAIHPDAVPQDTEERRRWISEALGGAADFRELMSMLNEHMRGYNSRFYRLRQAIDAEHDGQGYLWRICSAIEKRRELLFSSRLH